MLGFTQCYTNCLAVIFNKFVKFALNYEIVIHYSYSSLSEV